MFVCTDLTRSFRVQATGTIVHSSNLCLDRADIKSGGSIIIKPCTGADSQKWEFEHYLAANRPPTTRIPGRR